MIRKIFLGTLIIVLLLTVGYASATFRDSAKESGRSVTLTTVTLENCRAGTWVGGVKWVWKDGIRGNYIGSTYVDIPELELKDSGTLTISLEPGDYAITHYLPRRYIRTEHGKVFIAPAKIIEFREVTVGDTAITISFGCEE